VIIKGSSRGGSRSDAVKLSRHLLANENDRVAVLELHGVAATDLAAAIEEMRAIGLATRSRRPIYHASISPAADEALSLSQSRQAADELGRRLGLAGHPRAIVQHVKHGRAHIHIVWSRIDQATMTAVHDSQTYRKHEQCARALEARWRLRPVIGAHDRPDGINRPVATASHRDHQAERRTGVRVEEVAAILRRCWIASDNGTEFAALIRSEGLCLASGRRGLVIVDQAGTPHSIPRRLGIRAAEVQRRLADLDASTFPTVDQAKQPARPTQPKRKTATMPPLARQPSLAPSRFEAAASRSRHRRHGECPALDSDYWSGLGFTVVIEEDFLTITLPRGNKLIDRGDSLSLVSDGEPSDEEIRLIVAAGRARGWTTIHFSGGSPEWQRRARLEALRQGFPESAISIECEDGKRPVAMLAMPDHLKRRLKIPAAPDNQTAPEAPMVPTGPVPESRP